MDFENATKAVELAYDGLSTALKPPLISFIVARNGEAHRGVLTRNDLPEAISGGVPTILAEDSMQPSMRDAGDTMYQIGSLSKPVLGYLVLSVIYEGSVPGIQLDTPVLLDPRYKEITLKSVLLHTSGLPQWNEIFFLSDGTIHITDKSFATGITCLLRHVRLQTLEQRTIDARNMRKEGPMIYSNINTALAILLLRRKTGLSMDELLHKYVLGPLRMERTYISGAEFITEQLARGSSANIAIGQRISGDLSGMTEVAPEFDPQDFVARTLFGMWSTTNDLSKFLQELSKNRNFGAAEALLQPYYFRDENGSTQFVTSIFGSVRAFTDDSPGEESLNYCMGQRSPESTPPKTSPSLAKDFTVRDIQPLVYYKGGTVDGSTSTVYFQPSVSGWVIVQANTAGPVDFTEPLARFLFRYCIQPRTLSQKLDEINLRMGQALERELRELAERAQPIWRRLGEEQDVNRLPPQWTLPSHSLLGTYWHKIHGLRMTIKADGMAESIRSDNDENGTTSGDTEPVDKPKGTSLIRQYGDRVIQLPMTEGVFIDRATTFEDFTLTVDYNQHARRGRGEVRLKGANELSVWIKDD